MVDPGTAMLIATAVAMAAKGAGDMFSNSKAKQASKRRSKEMKRETLGGLVNENAQGSTENTIHHLQRRARTGKRKSQSLQDTSDLVREAFKI